jgi:hypothetical protein
MARLTPGKKPKYDKTPVASSTLTSGKITPVVPQPTPSPVNIQLINPQPQSMNIPAQAKQQSVAPAFPQLINPQPQSMNIPVSPSGDSNGALQTTTTPPQQPTSSPTAPVMQPGSNLPPQSTSPSTPNYDPLAGVENRPGYAPQEQKLSYFEQTGQYQYDFSTPEGQKERLQSALSIMTSKQAIIEAATNALIVTAISGVFTLAPKVFKALAGMNKLGQVALSPGGASAIASAIPEAAGIAPAIAKVGLPLVNTATTAAKVGFITKLLTTQGVSSALGIGAIVQGISGATSTREKISDYIKDSGELIMKLREAGMTDMADELAESNKDLRDGWDLIIPYLPVMGKHTEMNKVQGYRDKLNEDLNAYDAKVRSDKEKQAADKLAADQAAKIEQRAYDEKQLADKRAYEEKQLTDKRAYDEQQAKDKAAADAAKADKERQQKQQDVTEQRTYTEQQAQFQANQQYDQLATATESAGSSTLNFGLLSSGGSIEFVDRDKASQVYFGKPYELLDPAQKRLLDLSKGG